jgi:hypothetical protein
MPEAIIAAADRRTSSVYSAKVQRTGPSTTASRSGNSRAARSSTLGIVFASTPAS